MRRAMLFAVLSIQQPIIAIPGQLEEYEERGADSAGIWGHKLEAAAWIEDNYKRIWSLARSADTTPAELIWAIIEAPGIGIVKGAFIAQLAGFDVACLDSQNAKRLELDVNAFRTRGGANKRSAACLRRLLQYVSETSGTARTMWDDWCAYVAPIHKRTAFEISALHLAIIEEEI
tara:strand:- start:1028 stop:1552 length:525 start_codon:yes stop_codon:yes gene_type:complete